jgi:hypothetical protein
LARFAANYGRSGDVSFGDGDLNADGKVSLTDLIIMKSYMSSFTDEVGIGIGLVAIPEPATQLLAFFAIAIALSRGVWRRRLHRASDHRINSDLHIRGGCL